MQRDNRRIESSLQAKGFKKDDKDHHYFLYWTLDGKLITIKTKASQKNLFKKFWNKQGKKQIH